MTATATPDLLTDPRIQSAIEELKARISARYPEATFAIGLGDDPEGVYLTATVDVEDRGDVIDLFIDRLVDIQVDEALPVYVIPARPPERTAALLRDRHKIRAEALPR